MKVLYIFSTSIISGAEYVSIDLIKTDRQNEYFVLTSDIPELCKLLEDIIPVSHIYKSKWLRLQKVSSSRGILKLFRLIKKAFSVFIVRNKIRRLEKKIKPDLIIGHNTHDAIFLYKSSTKKILQVYDYLTKTSHLYFMVKSSYENVSKYIVDSTGLKKNLVSVGLDAYKIEVVPNSISVKLKEPKKIAEKSFVLLWIGSFEDRKDPLEFFKILELLIKNNFEFEVNFVFRKTDLLYYEKNFNHINDLSKYRKINVFENLPRKDLEKIYERSNILIFTSKEDSCPVVVVETMSFGIPVISKDIDGVYELIEPGKNSFLYKEINEIPVFLSQMLLNYSEFSKNALETIKKSFSPEAKLKNVQKIFNELLT
ncbi:MAG: glycosyltransferase family 4 protein [Brevinematia bacterium]